jgi:hypothetical protein
MNNMAIYSKGQKGYAGAYSPDDPDFKPAGDNLASYPVRGKPTQPGGGYGPPDGNRHDFNAIDLSGTIDPQVKYGFGFDDNKNSNWSADRGDSALGGFSGVASRSNNHPRYRR